MLVYICRNTQQKINMKLYIGSFPLSVILSWMSITSSLPSKTSKSKHTHIIFIHQEHYCCVYQSEISDLSLGFLNDFYILLASETWRVKYTNREKNSQEKVIYFGLCWYLLQRFFFTKWIIYYMYYFLFNKSLIDRNKTKKSHVQFVLEEIKFCDDKVIVSN